MSISEDIIFTNCDEFSETLELLCVQTMKDMYPEDRIIRATARYAKAVFPPLGLKEEGCFR
jgi:uncharacterized membrane protein YfbV (UPF0208 family)